MSCSVPVDLLIKRRSVDSDRPPRNRLQKHRLSAGSSYAPLDFDSLAQKEGDRSQWQERKQTHWPRWIRSLKQYVHVLDELKRMNRRLMDTPDPEGCSRTAADTNG